jgi:hypothetical protein
MARFLMNVMLASGGFPWTVIRVEDRDDYLHALDSASIETDIKPFAQFIERSVRQSLDSGRHRELTFSAPQERYISSREVVVYFGQDGERRVRCAISREALDDHFHGDHRNKLDVFRENRKAIEATTRRKYLDGELEPDNSVLVRTADIRSRVH